MSGQRFWVLLVAALVALAAAFYLSAQRNPPREMQGDVLLPTFAGSVDSVDAVIVRKGGDAPVTVHKIGTQWSVAERGDYPADLSKLRTLLTALRDARIVEEKTANPQRYRDIGVEDPTASAKSSEVTLQIGKPPAPPTAATLSVIVGKPVGDGSFVRRAGEKQSYSVQPAISFETAPRFWIDARLLDVREALIQRLEVKPAAGGAYTLHRLNPADNTFGIDGVPVGRKALDARALAPSPTLLANLTADDVSPVEAVDFNQPSQVIVTLLDGNIITLTGTALGDKRWIQVQSPKDSALTAKAQGRAFEVAPYRYDAIFKPLDQLLVPKESPAKATPAAPGAVKKSHPVPRMATPAS